MGYAYPVCSILKVRTDRPYGVDLCIPRRTYEKQGRETIAMRINAACSETGLRFLPFVRGG